MATATVTLYRKQAGCGLCDEAAALLGPIAARLGLALEEVDITADPALFDRYQFDIPVVVYQGHEIARGRVVA